MRTPLDLRVGDCYVELDEQELERGEVTDLDTVEVVRCSEPHSHEVIFKYPSVPSAYRDSENPGDALCSRATLDYISSLHPDADDALLRSIYEKFNDRFMYFYYQYIGIDRRDVEFDKEITCSIMSQDSLTIGRVQTIIENW